MSDRVTLASLFDGDDVPGAYWKEDWTKIVQALAGTTPITQPKSTFPLALFAIGKLELMQLHLSSLLTLF